MRDAQAGPRALPEHGLVELVLGSGHLTAMDSEYAGDCRGNNPCLFRSTSSISGLVSRVYGVVHYASNPLAHSVCM